MLSRVYIHHSTYVYEWMNEWMMHLYSTLLCIAVHPKRFTIVWGGGGLSSTTTSVQHPLGWCDGCHRTTAPVRSPHTSYRWRGEREIEPIKWMGIIRRPWLTRASGGNLARTPGLHPYTYENCMGFLMTRECQDLGLMSHPKDRQVHEGQFSLASRMAGTSMAPWTASPSMVLLSFACLRHTVTNLWCFWTLHCS